MSIKQNDTGIEQVSFCLSALLQKLLISSDAVDLNAACIISYRRGDIYVKDRINNGDTE